MRADGARLYALGSAALAASLGPPLLWMNRGA